MPGGAGEGGSKRYFFGAGWVTQSIQIRLYLNRQKYEKGYFFSTETGARKSLFHSLSLKRGMIFQLRGHSDSMFFHRCRTHMLTK